MVTISRDTLLLTGGLALGAGIYYLFNKKEKERRESNSRQEMQEMMMQMAARRGSLQPGDRAMSYMDPQAAASQFKQQFQGTSGGIYDRGYNTPGPYPMSPGQHEPLTNVPSITNNPMRASVVPSMEDIVKNQNAAAREMENLTPRKVLSRLQQGNARFWMGVAQRPEMSAMERRAMIMQQFPKVAVLGCSDSRVPIEIVFDQGLGDVFAIRVAGNSYGTGAAASIDYAVAHLKVKLVVVLGHEGCGAVRAAMLPVDKLEQEPAHLSAWLVAIKSGLQAHTGLTSIQDLRARDREAVITNVRAQMQTISRSPLIAAKVASGALMVVGAFYEITSGMVDFIDVDGDAADMVHKDPQPPPSPGDDGARPSPMASRRSGSRAA